MSDKLFVIDDALRCSGLEHIHVPVNQIIAAIGVVLYFG